MQGYILSKRHDLIKGHDSSSILTSQCYKYTLTWHYINYLSITQSFINNMFYIVLYGLYPDVLFTLVI